MIKHISRNTLDEDRYNACVTNSAYGLVYGHSWYLDLVCDQWSALVMNDYEAVMPLPWNSKLGLKYISQPYFCQQLGVFSSGEVEMSTVDLFFKAIPSSFFKIDMNTNLPLEKSKPEEQINYILDLNQEYESILKGYRKDRRKSLRKSSEAFLTFQDFENKQALINLYRGAFGYLELSEKYYRTIDKLIDGTLEQNHGFIRNVFYDEQLICSGFFIHFNNRIYYMFGASNKQGKKIGATTFLIDSVIKEFAESETVFDFEGSNVESIASFYKSFGSQKTTYYKYSSNVIQRKIF